MTDDLYHFPDRFDEWRTAVGSRRFWYAVFVYGIALGGVSAAVVYWLNWQYRPLSPGILLVFALFWMVFVAASGWTMWHFILPTFWQHT